MCEVKTLATSCVTDDPGVKPVMYFIPKSELTVFPRTKLQMSPANNANADRKTIGEAFSYVSTSGKGYWRKAPIMPLSGVVDHDKLGDIYNAGLGASFSAMLTDDSAEQVGWLEGLIQCAKCGELIIAVESPNGEFRIIGDDYSPCTIAEGKLSSGDKIGGKAREGSFKITSMRSAYTYPKTLTALNLSPNA